MSLEALFAELEQARDSWAELYDLFVRGKYDLAGARPALNGQSVGTLHRRAAYILDGLAALRPSDPQSPQAMLLFAKASDVRPSLQSLIQMPKQSSRPYGRIGRTGEPFATPMAISLCNFWFNRMAVSSQAWTHPGPLLRLMPHSISSPPISACYSRFARPTV